MKVQQRALPSLQVNPDTLLLQKSVHGQRYEAVLNLQLRNADFTEVSLSASAPFLKLSRTRVIMSTDNEERFVHHFFIIALHLTSCLFVALYSIFTASRSCWTSAARSC